MLIPGILGSLLYDGDASMVMPGMFGSMVGLAAGLSFCPGEAAGDWQAAKTRETAIRAMRLARRTVTGGLLWSWATLSSSP